MEDSQLNIVKSKTFLLHSLPFFYYKIVIVNYTKI